MKKERLLNETAAARLGSLPYSVEVLHYQMGPALIDIEQTVKTISAWIYVENYGVKMFMFGMDRNAVTLGEFIQIVEANAPEYIGIYHDLYIVE